MPISSSSTTSRRGYLSAEELEQYSDIEVIDDDEAADQISQAEEIIDSFVGYQQKFLQSEFRGLVASVPTTTSFTIRTLDQNQFENNYFKGCEVEIIGGTGEGQRRRITQSTKAGVCTVEQAWTVTPDVTSYYAIYQLGKFPRYCDVDLYSDSAPFTYYKRIPEMVKRAVAAQVQYIIEMGDKYFSTDQSEKQSESIGDYSYSNGGQGSGGSGLHKLIAPKARMYLRGIKNRLGRIIY